MREGTVKAMESYRYGKLIVYRYQYLVYAVLLYYVPLIMPGRRTVYSSRALAGNIQIGI